MLKIHSHSSRNSVAIIGGGLVGGAILRELVLRWVRGHGEEINVCGSSQFRAACPEIETIYVTTRTEPSSIQQLQKIKEHLAREKGAGVEETGPMGLIISSGTHRLRIEAETLDIIPKALTSSTVDDENFRKTSSLYSYLRAKQPGTLILGVNLASVASYHKKEIQNLVLSWVLITLKQAADECGIDTVALI